MENEELNIIQAQLKFNNKLIILLSGLSGTFKNKIAKDLANHFNINVISLRFFIKNDYNKEQILTNGYKFVDCDNIEAYDWKKFNSYIEEKSKTGIIVYGFSFPKDLISFEPNFHFNIKITKQKYIEERHKFLKENPKSNKKLLDLIKSKTENLMINDYIYPNYLDYIKRSDINRFFNANEKSIETIFDEIFDYIINNIEKNIYNRKDTKNTKDTKDIKHNYLEDDSSSSYNPIVSFEDTYQPESNDTTFITTLPNYVEKLDPFLHIKKIE
jgi:hypothetical protein